METKVFEVVSTVMNVPLDQVNLESDTNTIEAWDSLKQMTLMLSLEEAFGITFDDDLVTELTSVRNILKHVEKLKNN
jgi:acyl carrier protein